MQHSPSRRNSKLAAGSVAGSVAAGLVLLLSLFGLVVLAACSPGTRNIATKGPVTVASKVETENALLGAMIVHILQADGFEVNDRTQFGPTDVVRRALLSNEIDIYPEYTGNGAFFFAHEPRDVWKDPVAAYNAVAGLDREAHGILWLQPAPANNTLVIAVRKDLAEDEGLSSLEDLAAYMRDGGRVRLAAGEWFVSRDNALPAFENAYGFRFQGEQLLLLPGGTTTQAVQAAARRTDGANLAVTYGTDGQLPAMGLTALIDTLGVQPVYQPAPVVRAAVLTEYPEIEELLSPVFAALTLEVLQALNASIQLEGHTAETVAREYLSKHGFIN